MGTYIDSHAGDSQLVRVFLLEISLDTVKHFTSYDIPVVTDGTKVAPAATWSPLPFKVSGVTSSQGQISPSGSLSLPNADKVLGLIFLNLPAMSGKEIRVYEGWLAPSSGTTISQDEKLIIQGVTDSPSVQRNEISLSIGPYVPLEGRIIPRRKINTACQLDYKGALCGATGPDSTCDKSLSECVKPTKTLPIASLSSVSCSGNVVTYTTSTPHGIALNQIIEVYGCSDPTFDGIDTAYNITTYSFKVHKLHTNQSSTSVTGNVYGSPFGNLSRFGGFPILKAV